MRSPRCNWLVLATTLGSLVASTAFADGFCESDEWIIETTVAMGDESGAGGTGIHGEGSGVGGTGIRGEGSGVGGTGIRGEGSGVGGTGIRGEGSGVGGTGIFGTISRIGSICVNGLHVHLEPGVSVERHDGGESITSDGLTVGQTVWLIARSTNGRLSTNRIDVLADAGAGVDDRFAAEWIAARTGRDPELERLSVEGHIEASRGNDRFAVRGLDLLAGRLSDAQRTALRDRAAASGSIRIVGRLRPGGVLDVERASAPRPTGLERPAPRIEPGASQSDGGVDTPEVTEPAPNLAPIRPPVGGSSTLSGARELLPTDAPTTPTRTLLPRNAVDAAPRTATTGADVADPIDRIGETRALPDSIRNTSASDYEGSERPDASPREVPSEGRTRPVRGEAGTRLDRPEKGEPGGRPEAPERPIRLDSGARPTRPEKIDRPEIVERPARPERPEIVERPARPERPEKIERPDRLERPERPEKVERPDRPEKPERVERLDR